MNIQQFTTGINPLQQIELLQSETKYVCSIKDPNYLDEYIHTLVQFHSIKKNIIYSETYTIQYELCNSNHLQVEYVKEKKKYPLLSILCFFLEHNSPILFSEIDMNEYKYKEFKNQNNIGIYHPEKGVHIVFDSSKYYGALNIDTNVNNVNNVNKYLKINLWDIQIKDLVFNTDISQQITEPIDIKEKNTSIFEWNEEIYDNSAFENIIYKTNDPLVMSKLSTIFSHRLKNTNLMIVRYNKKEGINYLKLVSKHGDCIKDFISIIDDKLTIEQDNVCYKNKIIKNILSPDICYWILNECFIYKLWKLSTHKNYEYQVNLESFPHLLNYILFVLNFWLIEIRKMYSIPNTLNLNIKEIFIAKYSVNKIIKEKTCDGNFLVMNIQLNDTMEYKDGEIIFNHGTDEIINLNACECIIYNGKKMRTPGNVSYGEKFVLVIMIELLL